MTTLTFSVGGAPRTLFILLKGAPGTLHSWPVQKTLPGKSPLKTTRVRTPELGTPQT